LIKENFSKEIVAHSVNEEALSKKAYIKKVKDAEQRIDSGKYTRHTDLGEEMKNW